LVDCLDPAERLRLRYDTTSRPDVCSALGLRVLFALDATDEIACVPCSHTTDPAYPAPKSLAEIEALNGTVIRPELAAGDVLLAAAPTVVALHPRTGTVKRDAVPPPRVLESLLMNPSLCAPGLGHEPRPLDEVPAWFKEMTPAQQAVLGPREGRPGGGVATDGERVWSDASEADFAWSDSAEAAKVPRPLMNTAEMWQWATQGYLVVPGVMDAAWIEGCNTALDAFRTDQSVVKRIGPSELWPEPDCSPSLLPAGPDPDDADGGSWLCEERMSGLEGLPSPHSDPFRRMVAHPAVVERLNWMMVRGNQFCLS
jgi:hypothetical protein